MSDPNDEQSSSRSHYRLGGLASFIPLNEEQSAISTRGRRLPSIFHTRSSTSLFTGNQRLTAKRRASFHSASSAEDDLERGTDDEMPSLADFSPLRRRTTHDTDPRRASMGPEILNTPQMRSMRLIGNSNPRYRWEQYFKTEAQLKKMKKPLREYYERNNYLIAHYSYIDRLLDSSLPHDLIQEYHHQSTSGQTYSPMSTIAEVQEPASASTPSANGSADSTSDAVKPKIRRTPKELYKVPDPSESTPLLMKGDEEPEDLEADETTKLLGENADMDFLLEDEGVESNDPVVLFAVYLNLAANAVLLVAKIAVIVLTSSLSVLASLVDAALDFLSTAIVWTTTKLISHQDQYAYPIGRRRLEPVGVLVFSIIMITSFVQVGLECLNRLFGNDHTIVELSIPSVVIMVSTVVIKGFCYFWCRLVKNSSVQALAQDAMTDCVFNTFSIIFPLIGYYARIWWMDALGGLLLSIYVIVSWAHTSSEHVRNLCGAAATPDQRNVLLYLTMRFAKTIRYIQGLQAYHTGDKLNVEVDIVLDENMSLRDSHDLGESLQYVLESVPTVDRAFVHADYADWNLPSHMNQQSE